jgi:hypothetical protein
MAQRFGDEQQHRRGLVLGLTLAEVLILLIFLLLLALAARLQQLQRERDQYASVLGTIASMLTRELDAEPSTPGTPTEASPGAEAPGAAVPTTRKPDAGTSRVGMPNPAQHDAEVAGARTPSAKKMLDPKRVDVEKLIAVFRDAGAHEEQLRALRPAMEAAEKIDPNEPPATVLKRGIDLLNADQRRAISQMSTKGGAGKKVAPAIAGAVGNRDGKDRESPGEHNWPPIISLSEADGEFFQSGSAELPTGFRSKLEGKVVDTIIEIIKKYNVDVIEVIGHTDEQPLKPRPSNLDSALIPYLAGKGAPERVAVSDNAGLGLARAAAVVSVLLADERLRIYKVLPLSGGQLIQIGDILSPGSPGDVKERRRIEIRARRSTPTAQAFRH